MRVQPTRRPHRRAAAALLVLAALAVSGCVQTREQRQDQRFGSDYGGFRNDSGALEPFSTVPQSFGSGR